MDVHGITSRSQNSGAFTFEVSVGQWKTAADFICGNKIPFSIFVVSRSTSVQLDPRIGQTRGKTADDGVSIQRQTIIVIAQIHLPGRLQLLEIIEALNALRLGLCFAQSR